MADTQGRRLSTRSYRLSDGHERRDELADGSPIACTRSMTAADLRVGHVLAGMAICERDGAVHQRGYPTETVTQLPVADPAK
jgi:hypothetical protein